MTARQTIANKLRDHARRGGALRLVGLMTSFMVIVLTAIVLSCKPEPPLFLYEAHVTEMELPVIDLDLEIFWDYELSFDVNYDWRALWYYGWDEEDRRLFGEIGYTEPDVFNLRRYYTGQEAKAPHTGVLSHTVNGTHFQDRYDWGFWDILVWNEIKTLDGVQSLIFDEETTLDSVTVHTNQSMNMARYQAPRWTHAFYQPEPLFAAYDEAIEINRDLTGFIYDPVRNIYHRTLNMTLMPITYIYLTQIILHNNRGRIAAVDGSANLSGMARATTLNNGRASDDPITVYYNVRLKRDMPYVPFKETSPAVIAAAERVDIIGGRLMTFGICGQNSGAIKRREDVRDRFDHFMDVTLQFNNGIDSTMVFDVTDTVRARYKGGVITIELDVDTIPIPQRKGGSGFNAVVQDFEDGGTHEFEM